jgi:hypothetical protein
MQDGCVHANGYCVDEDAVELRQAEMLVHDAAAAHALMQALDDVTDKIFSKYARGLIDQRADEIMAGWGFDSGEVE